MALFRARALSFCLMLTVAWAIALSYSAQISAAAFHQSVHLAEKYAAQGARTATVADAACPLCDALLPGSTPEPIVDALPLLVTRSFGVSFFTFSIPLGADHAHFSARAPPVFLTA